MDGRAVTAAPPAPTLPSTPQPNRPTSRAPIPGTPPTGPAPGPGRAGRNLPAAVGVGFALFAAILLSLLLVRWLFAVVVAAAVVLGVLETAGAMSRRGIVLPRVPVLLGSLATVAAAAAAGPDGLVIGAGLAVTGVVVATLVAPARAPASPTGTGAGPRTVPDSRDAAAAVFTVAWIALLGGFACLLLRPADGAWRALTLILVVVCSDTGGYVAGVLAGRHPMAPRLSPKKSWEGAAGSAVLGTLGAFLGVTVLLDGPWWAGVLLGPLAVGTATAGDLGESLLKRDLGIKDMSSLLPGHGGLMDRMDSMLAAAPVVWLVLALTVAVPGGSAWT